MPVCSGCREPIAGAYLRVGKQAYHPQHFRCGDCRQPIDGPFRLHERRYLHPACYAKRAPRCGICGEPLLEGFVKDAEGSYHEACYGKHKAEPCAVCRRRIVGASLKDFWGNVYHAEHAREMGTCHYCGRLTHANVGKGGVQYADGRVICRLCHKTAMHRDPDAQRATARVQGELAALGIETRDVAIPVRFVDRNALMRAMAGGPHKGLAFLQGVATMETAPGGAKRGSVSLLTGMPLTVLEGLAAHELMHIWNFYNGPKHAFAFEEGACNYVASLIWKARAEAGDLLAGYQIAQMEASPHPAYGAGYRRVRAYAEAHGLPALLATLRKRADLPLLGRFGVV